VSMTVRCEWSPVKFSNDSRQAATIDFCSTAASSLARPAASAKYRAAPPAAAASRASGSICNSMTLKSTVTVVVRKGHIASFPAVRAIIQSVCAELHVDLPLANRAVFFAAAIAFRLVTLSANDGTRHGSLQENST